MNKITIFIAALYQRLNDKDPDTPYLNLRMIITFNFIFHLAQFHICLKNHFHQNNLTGSTLFYYLVIMGAFIFYISSILFPRDVLEDAEINNSIKKHSFRIAVNYFAVNFILLMVLLFHYLPIG